MGTIEDGRSGQTADVTDDHRLKTASLIRTGDRVVAVNSGKVWSINFQDVDPTGADDYFVYIKNDSASVTYIITDIRIVSTVVGRGQVQFVSGTASGGTDITPVTRNSAKKPLPSLTMQYGVDITGLTNEGTVFYLWPDTVGEIHHLRTSSGIIIEPGGAVALLWEESTGILTGTVSIEDLSEVSEL